MSTIWRWLARGQVAGYVRRHLAAENGVVERLAEPNAVAAPIQFSPPQGPVVALDTPLNRDRFAVVLADAEPARVCAAIRRETREASSIPEVAAFQRQVRSPCSRHASAVIEPPQRGARSSVHFAGRMRLVGQEVGAGHGSLGCYIRGSSFAMSSRIEALRSILQASPNDCFVRYGLAQEHVKTGDDAAAIDEFVRILEIDASYQAAYYHAGKAYQRLGRVDEARAIYQRGVEVSIANGDSHARGELETALSELPPAS